MHLYRRDDLESSNESTDFQFKRWNYDKVEVLGHQAVRKNPHLFPVTTFDEAVYNTVSYFVTRKDGQILMAVDCDESRTPVVVVMPKFGHAGVLTITVDTSITLLDYNAKTSSGTQSMK